mmetsp:Transcript_15629/g.27420  ORF Transcript_15629/g.27420 Transcript_15629/m.27420 type:complete len:503 (+) Transcript_15629:181-1689(+)|eukprot:CAMPEP_0184700972 /NCGR_PEP_ID=MMETSP0313-20130426/17382_1 /TAXON_ID=2792 /ORGANISM="Porphyridium aerugineum, Strain SAG 1380-2" /LENGTH=502 /DNA_ID=CAMNT_0027160867 /DNA_START=142 /DNA_END=1650 /DNA_ORIENTATION=-
MSTKRNGTEYYADIANIASHLAGASKRLHINSDGQWSTQQLSAALFYACKRNDDREQSNKETIKAPPLKYANDILLAEMKHYCRYADAAYSIALGRDAMIDKLGSVSKEDIIHIQLGGPTSNNEALSLLASKSEPVSKDDPSSSKQTKKLFDSTSSPHQAAKFAVNIPAFFIAIEPFSNTVILSIRGTKEMNDVFIDLSIEAVPFLEGYGHAGVVRAALALKYALKDILVSLIQGDDSFVQGKALAFVKDMQNQTGRSLRNLVIIGHSLGAATAAVLAIMLRRETDTSIFRDANTRCFAFAPPPSTSENFIQESLPYVTSVILGFDVVPRMSAASLDRFLARLARYDWERDASMHMENAMTGYVPRAVSAAVGATAAAFAKRYVEARINSEIEEANNNARNAAASTTKNTQGKRASGSFNADMKMVSLDPHLQDPKDVYILGRIFHIRHQCRFGGERLVECTYQDFREMIPSTWMIYDHSLQTLRPALEIAVAHAEFGTPSS